MLNDNNKTQHKVCLTSVESIFICRNTCLIRIYIIQAATESFRSSVIHKMNVSQDPTYKLDRVGVLFWLKLPKIS